jgi:hypothetical protein
LHTICGEFWRNLQKKRFNVEGSRFEVQGLKFKVQGTKFQVQGSKFQVQGSRFKIQSSRFCPFLKLQADNPKAVHSKTFLQRKTLNFEP